MCKPHRCPHIAMTGNICVYAHLFLRQLEFSNLFICRYCPGGPDSDFDYSTQSYTGYEPTSMRAIRARYDPYEQTRGRVEQLKSLGHNVDKVCYLVTNWCISIAIRIVVRFLGGIYRNGRYIYEYARRLPREVHRAVTQCSFPVLRVQMSTKL